MSVARIRRHGGWGIKLDKTNMETLVDNVPITQLTLGGSSSLVCLLVSCVLVLEIDRWSYTSEYQVKIGTQGGAREPETSENG